MRHRLAMAATVMGAGIGLLGGLIGLGGAEFRLPVLVGFFARPLRQAIGLNLSVRVFTVVAALAVRLGARVGGLPAPAQIMVTLAGGGVLGPTWERHG